MDRTIDKITISRDSGDAGTFQCDATYKHGEPSSYAADTIESAITWLRTLDGGQTPDSSAASASTDPKTE